MNDLNHIGLIPDGTRRWSKRHNISLPDGYWLTMQKITDAITVAFDNNIKIMTIYLLSTHNLNRKEYELNSVMDAETKLLQLLLPEIIEKYECRVVHAGIMDDRLSQEYKNALSEICEKSKKYKKRILNLLIAYNPQDEIKQAVKKDHENFMNHLWVNEHLDMVIRTSGEKRLSNFVPLQCGYAEAHLLKKHIPEITKNDMINSIEEYKKRHRRKGE
ncbi:hypothetical protein BEH94_06920 [Candidatus Altiarchaeales archaeon WOR_SM1_SCG]|nr:hypothetical protein BEH94_06920 [Candidatus Altiarchaeales archaeon WOR_SM1_SCG]